jgi:hypothetical protein
MFFSMNRRRLGAVVFAAGLVLVTTAALGLAAKPGGGGSAPAGRIYYRWTNEVYAEPGGTYEFRGWWSMNADGSDKRLTTYQPLWSDGRHHLSHFEHYGYRWYLEVRPSVEYFPKTAVYAVREDGDADHAVLLLEAGELPGSPGLGKLRWGKDDSFFSFVAQASATDALAEISIAGIAFDELTGLPALMTPPVPIVQGEQTGWMDIRSHDWSPDGTQVAYGLEPNGGSAAVKIKDLLTGETRLLADRAYYPVWSPDGTRIAFKPFNEGVHVIRPDGSGLMRLTNNRWDAPSDWSADSAHVIFWRGGYYKGSGVIYIADVFRVSAAGGSAINLTKDIDGYATSFDWR